MQHGSGRFSRQRGARLFRLSRLVPMVMFGICSMVLLASSGSYAYATPCAKHENSSKRACLKQYKRDKMEWPPEPVRDYEIKRRVGSYNWAKAYRVAVCETGRTINWHLTGTYRGSLGMYVTTWGYGVSRTGYNGDTWAEQVAIAVAAHPITHGWGGWGCGGA